jgi:hypothetical protein
MVGVIVSLKICTLPSLWLMLPSQAIALHPPVDGLETCEVVVSRYGRYSSVKFRVKISGQDFCCDCNWTDQSEY